MAIPSARIKVMYSAPAVESHGQRSSCRRTELMRLTVKVINRKVDTEEVLERSARQRRGAGDAEPSAIKTEFLADLAEHHLVGHLELDTCCFTALLSD